jgi:DTW domain-containing protein YfiP
MFRKSPWLDTLPVISVDLNATSAYQLREAHGEGQYCTAEVAIALLELSGDVVASRQLTRHFTLFRERYLAGKAHHSHKVTAKLEESI